MNFRRQNRGAGLPLCQLIPLLSVAFLLLCLFLVAAGLAPTAREPDVHPADDHDTVLAPRM